MFVEVLDNTADASKVFNESLPEIKTISKTTIKVTGASRVWNKLLTSSLTFSYVMANLSFD